MDNELKEDINEKIVKEIEESERIRQKENEEFINNKNSLQDGIKLLLKETLIYRKELKLEKDEIFKEREMLKGKQNSRREIERKLLDIINDSIDLNSAISVYKEILLSGFKSDLVEKAFQIIRDKKEEQYRNDIKKMTPKDKQIAVKLLEEIKGLNLKISEDIMKKLNDTAGI